MNAVEKLPPTEDERCGTNTGDEAHRYRGEVPCDSCCRAHAAHDHAYHDANREAITTRKRAYYRTNREAEIERGRFYRDSNRDAIKERGRTRYDANREVAAVKNRAYYRTNREAIAEQKRAYRDANSEEIDRRERTYRARIAQAFASVAVHKYQAWAVEDDAIIRTTYDQPVVMVAAQLRRTPYAVDNRRAALRKLDRNQRKATA